MKAPSAKYEFRRLGFKADFIEPLKDDDTFQIDTPCGSFRMTKREFTAVFFNVVRSRSYREHGLYHYPTIPGKALQFLIRSQGVG